MNITDVVTLNEEVVAEARGDAAEGIRAIKMKIGLGSLKEDLDRVAAVGGAIGRYVLLRVDANHCFNVPQAWGPAIGLVATLHFLASLPECRACLVPMPPMLEYKQTFNPFRDDLSKTRLTHTKGWVHVPTGPGRGIDIYRSILDRYRIG